MDDISWMLLEELQRNGRASYRQLGAIVGLTAPAVAERMRKLEQSGVIEGYRAVVNYERVGLPILAVIRLKTRGEFEGKVGHLVQEIPEVIECHRVTGSESHVLTAVLRSTAHLEDLLDQLRPYSETITNIVTSSQVRNRVLTRPAVDKESEEVARD